MGFLDFLKKDKKEINLSKTDTTKKINLSKEEVKISLKKKNVESLVAEVQVAVDISGSMFDNFSNGSVQEALNRLIPISLNFDDDGVVQVYSFNTISHTEKELTIDNIDGYVNKNLTNKVSGGTNYAPTLVNVLNLAKRGKLKFPLFLIFITDGENADPEDTKDVLRELSNYDIYIQFVGVGHEDFYFLKELDNLKGRKFDNAGFINFNNFEEFNDKELYDKLLEEFIDIYKKNTFKTGKISLSK